VSRPDGRTSVLYLAPWVDYGGTDKGTIDWFRWLDRERFAPSLFTTQPSLNRRIGEVVPYAEEVWPGTEFFAGEDMPKVIFDILHTREVDVLHVMNSRLGFDLLPDLAALPRPPAVVVQLHVEEQDKSGYVRYVTTRYGNLADAFSLTSQHLADAVERYDIPRSKCRVIYTGVDAEQEFSPEHADPIPGLDSDLVHILYPGRLVEQKDPLLMVDVAAGLRERGLGFQLHVVGEGPLEAEVRSRVSERGLGEQVRFHPSTSEIARWYAACDLLLMTSVFEGVPYVIYEAMAMAVPIVAPALPGNAELMDGDCGTLVTPRGHAHGYVDALARLISDEELRRRCGEHARARVRERFSLKRMGEEHGRLYDELLALRSGDASARSNGRAAPALPEPLRLRSRPSRGAPLVSVIVPCFNHGRYLAGCLDSIRNQTYPSLEIFVVDDASTDPQTISRIEELERHATDVTVIRMPENGGPSAARNAAIEQARGRYLLPVDADNLLTPDAVERLVNQLQAAGERVGFVYPNLQFFGNRNEYFEAPDYNLYLLLSGNFADTSSLLDREIFDAGLRYPDDIVLGHEDWDFALSLAEREIYGEPAATKTLLYRKTGFTRSDLVEYGPELFHDRIVPRHPALFEREAEVKAKWAPSLTIVPLTPLADGEEQRRFAELAGDQSWTDFEVVAPAAEGWPDTATGLPNLRRIPPDLARSTAEALELGWQSARGRVVLVTNGSGLDLLADRAFIGKLMRTLDYNSDLSAIALTDAGDAGLFPLRLLREDDGVELDPHAVMWRVEDHEELGNGLRLAAGDELGSLTALIAGRLSLQWRHAPRPAGTPPSGATTVREITVRPPTRAGAKAERRLRLEFEPKIPEVERDSVRRWSLAATWMPPDTHLLCRHVRSDGERVITQHRESPPGYELEYDVCQVRKFDAQGTSRLIRLKEGGYAALDPTEPADHGVTIGFIEQAPLPLLDSLIVGVHRPTGIHVLIAGEDDPIADEVEPLETLGYVEGYPVNPRHPPHVQLPFRVKGLVRAVDRGARRHVYGIGELPSGELAGELGALQTVPDADSVPVWQTAEGTVVTPTYVPGSPTLDARSAVRWVGAPVTWRGGVAPHGALARASARRLLELPRAARSQGSTTATPAGEPVGYISRRATSAEVPLYSSIHPVTGDQLLTNSRIEAGDLGYVQTTLLGYLVDAVPLTGSRKMTGATVPWASRFGHNARTR
jgi:glycosyltransferase involved in cell wall biosynthesis